MNMQMPNPTAVVTQPTAIEIITPDERDPLVHAQRIQSAIDRLSQQGGGTICLQAGVHRVLPLRLRSGIELNLKADALLQLVDDFTAFGTARLQWSGVQCHGYHPCVYAHEAQDIRITGEGVIDGSGQAWWDEYHRRKADPPSEPTNEVEQKLKDLNSDVVTTNVLPEAWPSQFLRPMLIHFNCCAQVEIQGVTLRNSPFWNTHLAFCEDVTVQGVTFDNPPDAPNGDGLDLESCRRVVVYDCHFDVGDDCLCLKAGIEGQPNLSPCQDVLIERCSMKHGHGGVVLGSEMSGGIHNVMVRHCHFEGTDRGIRVKTRRGRGGSVDQLTCEDITMDRVGCPIVVNMFYRCASDFSDQQLHSFEPQPVDSGTPRIGQLTFRRIRATDAISAEAVMYGLPESPIEYVTWEDVVVSMTPDPLIPPGLPAMAVNIPTMRGVGMITSNIREMNEIPIA